MMLTVKEVCEQYGITRQTFYTALAKGAMGCTTRVHGWRLVDGERFRAWVEGNKAGWLHPLFPEVQRRRREGVRRGLERMRARKAELLEEAREEAGRVTVSPDFS